MRVLRILIVLIFANIANALAQTDTNLVASFNFDGNLINNVNSNLNATNQNATLTTNRINQANSAYNFAVGNQIIYAPIQTKKQNGFSLTAWISINNYPNPNALNTYQNILTMAGVSIYFQTAPDSSVYLIASTRPSTGSGQLLQATIMKKNLPLNKWVHVAYTFSPGVSQKFFVNGQLIKTASAGLDLKNGSNIALGNFFSTPAIANQFMGKIDDVRIYKKAIVDTTIAKIYNSENYTLYTGPVKFSKLCQLNAEYIPFKLTAAMDSTNKYFVELSDINGSFANPTILDSSDTKKSIDSVLFFIPATISPGTQYKIRLRTSAPLLYSEQSFSLTINPKPKVSLGNDIHICRGATIVLTATGAANYFWPGLGLSSDTISITPLETTHYMVWGIDSNGCDNFDTIKVTVDTSITPVINFDNTNRRLFSSISFGNQWYKDSVLLTAETDSMIDCINYGDGNYFTIVTDANGCVSEASNNLHVVLEGVNSSKYKNIKLFPNPNNGEFTIDTKSLEIGVYQLEIYNTLGQLVKKLAFNTTENKINVGQVSPGIYRVFIRNDKYSFSNSLMIR